MTPKCMLTEAEASERDKLQTPYRLAWFGRGGRARNSNSRQYFLTPAEATFISRLFQGLADGQPDVAEDELLKAGDAKSVSSLFPGMDGKSLSEPQIGPGGVMSPPPPGRIPPQDWNSLFVPGGQPKTWRLNVPKPAETPAAGAATTTADCPRLPDGRGDPQELAVVPRPGRDGHLRVHEHPDQVGRGKRREHRWKTEVPLPGNSSPVVLGRRVFLTGATKDQRQVFCFDAEPASCCGRRTSPAPRRAPPRTSE